ncbi:T9SS type A sorting domain-containing protein [Polaribacter batillariae]|uniref:T9SS type A sorting domain-containing protein n=1 Tax=Polaribacter batillariae TaxID=2808900 RepID=A0ABX7SWU0_9FLAO|nr:T9SS type A sorting domain-containing protein [Polaribacter batillariae]QTD38352.1 T9SS type A sorting domain-containing protein [Polaribacter batillariae]
MKKNYILTIASVLFCYAFQAQTFQTWRDDSGTGDNSWQNSVNWWNFPNPSPIVFGQQEWDNNHLPEQVNSSDISTWRFLYKAGASDPHTFTGNQISFFDFSGDDPQILNQSSATHIINNAIIGDPDATDPLKVLIDGTGGLTFGGTINNQGWLDINGSTATASSTIFNGVISGTGGVTKENVNISLIYKADNTYSGATNINNGQLVLEGDLTNSDVSVGANGSLQVSENVTIKSLTIAAGGSVIIDSDKSLTILNNLVNNGTSFNINSGASLIVNGTSTGNISYNLNIADTNWHLISSPVIGEEYNDAWIASNSIASGVSVATNRGISTYDNDVDANGNWVYYTTGGADTPFASGLGYSMLRSASGTYTFTGTLKTDDTPLTITQGFSGANKWNLIGNPYPSYIDIDAFLTANASQLSGPNESIYVYNGTSFAPLTTGYIHPGQAFFVNSDVISLTDNISITEAMQSHQTGVTFYKSVNTSINLKISDGTKNANTEINYFANKTKGLDRRFDIGSFTGVSNNGKNNLAVFTQLLEGNNGINFVRQALPNKDFESMIIPVGVTAEAGKEITFTAEALNLPTGLKVYLEDKTTNTITRLDEVNSKYKLTLSEKVDGTGRFFLHTKTSAVLSTDNDLLLNSIKIFKTNNSTLKISGLPEGKTTLSLYNLLGKKLVNTTFNSSDSNEVNLPKLATGVYLVNLETENGKLNKKIILE